MVDGIESGGDIQKGKGSDRPFGHIENIVMNIKEGTFQQNGIFSKPFGRQS